MSKVQVSMIGALLVLVCPLSGQTLHDAEVRIPYGELKRLQEMAKPPMPEPVAAPILRSVRLKLGMDGGNLVLAAQMGVTTFGAQRVQVPLIRGGLGIRSVSPEDALLVSSGGALCLSVAKQGNHDLQLEMLPVLDGGGFRFSVPECPSALLEVVDSEGMESVEVMVGEGGRVMHGGEVAPLSAGVDVTVRILDEREVREASTSPVPSEWKWQNQALVMPCDDSLRYAVIVRASADDGSGVDGFLPMPKEAMDVQVSGDSELVSHVRGVDDHGVSGMRLEWKTRGLLERRLLVTYQMPLRPLDRSWVLEAPGGEVGRTRFVIAEDPLLEMAADGLSGPLAPSGFPEVFEQELVGRNCRQIEGATRVEIAVTRVPVVAVDELTVGMAQWSLRIEPDGAMLVNGVLEVEHQRPVGLRIDTPVGMKLLSCEVNKQAVAPAALDGGWLKVPLASGKGTTRVLVSFTGRVSALDPVEGTLELKLPMVAHFIRSMAWQIELPDVYQAEVHGNLTRIAAKAGTGASRISLIKNLCRDERPETRVFYQRADLNR